MVSCEHAGPVLLIAVLMAPLEAVQDIFGMVTVPPLTPTLIMVPLRKIPVPSLVPAVPVAPLASFGP